MNLKRKHRRGETRVARRQRYRGNVRFLPGTPANESVFHQPTRKSWKAAALAAFLKDNNYVSRFDISPLPSPQDYASRPRTLRLRLERGLSQGILDRRRFYIGSVPPVARIGTRPNTELQPVAGFNAGLSRLAFSIPRNVLTCVRRKQRKQVLFATGKAGKSGQKKPKWNEESYIRC